MIDPAVAAPRLTPEQLEELQTLLEGADTVELKLTVPDGDQRSAIRALKMDPLEAEVRQVFFFDTPDLLLNQHGVIVRARRTPKGDDSIVKLRPVVPSELSADLRSNKGFGVEVDAMPGGFVCSGRMQAQDARREGEGGDWPASGPSSRSSTRSSAPSSRTVPRTGSPSTSWRPSGPSSVMKLKFSPSGYDGRLVAELWLYPDGSRILELSTKAATTDAFEVAARTRQFLEQQGIDLAVSSRPRPRRRWSTSRPSCG